MNHVFSTLKVLGFGFALFGVAAGVAYGQAISSNLVGTVLDASGAAVVNADMSATNIGTGVISNTKTGGTGTYRFENLPVGTYKVSAKATGFRTTTVEVELLLNHTSTVNVTLSPGAAAETIEVSGEAPAINTSSAQLESTFNTQYSSDLAITSTGGASGGVLNLSLLTTGVTNSSSLGLGAGPSVGGQRPRDNNFTVEGVDNNNKSVTGNLINVPNDAVQNFTLLSNQFDTEFGHSSGGQFNTTVKSGTNTFHGSVYEYFRNRDMNALDNYWVLQGLTKNPPYDNNRYGGTFGGPIIKNKLFFFTNYERQTLKFAGSSGGTVFSPTAAGVAAIALDPNISANNVSVFQHYVPVAPPVNAAKAACIQFNGQLPAADGGGPFPGQATPFSAPANGSCAAGSVETGPVSITGLANANYENFVQSVDFNLSHRDQIRGRFIFNRNAVLDTNAALPVFYLPLPYHYYLFTLGEYHTFSASLVNEFRFGFNRYYNTTPAGNFQFPGLSEFPNLVFNDLGAGLQVGPNPNAPQFTIQNLYQFVDNVSWTRGAHNFKFGAEYRWYISPQSFTQRQRGDYQYNNSQLYLEDFAPDFFGERSSGALTYYGNLRGIYGYASDNWRVNQNLTLNLGVRYEYNGVPLSMERQSLNTISNTPSIIVAGVNQPLLFNKPQAPQHNFVPRIGFAYSPGTSGTTSIRGGFGMAYDVLYDNIGILAVPPQVGATFDVSAITPGFLAGGGLPGGGSGIKHLDEATARAHTSNWIPNQIQWPYSINWNFGIQHSFGKAYTAEIGYVGTRGVHLDAQTRIDRQVKVTPQDFLPTYTQAPPQAQLDALTTTLTSINKNPSFIPAYSAAGFHSNIVCDCPFGSSIYHGLHTSLTRRFSNGLQFQAAYTFSRNIDNDTADFFSTYLTPRRPQDFQDFASERSVSPLSRTHRFTLAAVYEMPFFKSDNWLKRNVLGNWSFSPVYTYESAQWVDVQSANDANLNGDAAGDRTVINPTGVPGIGSGVNPLTNTAGAVVAYCACQVPGGKASVINPNAYYIQAGKGALATGGRNTLASRPTNNLDFSVYKYIGISERFKFQLGGQLANILNHPQYIPAGNPGTNYGVNDVESFATTTVSYLSYVSAANPNFNKPKTVFPSNSRTISIVARFIF